MPVKFASLRVTAFVLKGATLIFLMTAGFLCQANDERPAEYQPSVNIERLLQEAPARGQVTEAFQAPSHFADATAADSVKAGLKLYKVYCASCHGRQLQGQALWQAHDAYEGLRAPPHDDTGHTWQHSDEDLFAKVRRHAFDGILTDEQILQALSFIKARWSLALRVAQSTLNPDFLGMPADALSVEWTFPPTCLSAR